MQSLEALRKLRVYSAKQIYNDKNEQDNNLEDTNNELTKIYPKLPNEILWEIFQFLKVKECAKIASVSIVFYQLTVPRMKVGLQVVIFYEKSLN